LYNSNDLIVTNITEFIERIEELRKAKGITAGKLQQLSDVSSATFTKWRYERAVPSVSSIRSIAKVLGVTPEYLANGVESNGSDDEKRPAPKSESMNSAMQLMSELGDCTPSEVSATLAFVKLLKSQRNQ